ncbi:hypothetical protein C8Q75DRAFT_785972 [Abortiporus biennis]|nr:hypothetical protein C8Q75DRAFT_785972 [Abortiporus biennis]
MAKIPVRKTIDRATLREGDLTRLVNEFVIAGTAAIPGNPPDSNYHFCISLVFEDKTAIRLNLNPYFLEKPEVPTRGQLLIESIAYPASTTETIQWSSPLVTPVPAGDILEFILVANKRDQFDFDSNGEGCRFWCEVILKDLIHLGVLDSDELGSFNVWEEEQINKEGARVLFPRPQGTFYD